MSGEGDAGTSATSVQDGAIASTSTANIGQGSMKNLPLNGFESFRKQALDVAQYTGPYSQFWNLLVGNTRVVSHDIIMDQLKSRCDKLISMLTLYSDGTQSHSPTEKTLDIKHVIKQQIMDKLSVSDKMAVELLCTYIVFEYNGVVTGLKTLLSTKSSQAEFLNRIEAFYKRERLCLIYCSQVILTCAADESHVYYEVFGGFIASASLKNWIKWTCVSMQDAIVEEERIEILHTMTIMIHHYCSYPQVLDTFKKYYNPISDDDITYEIRQAEAVFFAALMQCGTEDDDDIINRIVMDYFDVLKANDLLIFPMLHYFRKRCPKDVCMRRNLERSIRRRNCVSQFTSLVKAYSSDGFKYRHGVGSIALKCFFDVLEVVMAHYHIESLGTKPEYFELLDSFLKNKEIAFSFLCERPSHITSLYEESLYLFPVCLVPLLSIWASIAQTSNENISALEIVEKATQINCLAEYYSNVDHRDVIITEKFVVLNVDHMIGTARIPAGTKGHLIRDTCGDVLIWSLVDTITDTDVWQVIFRTLLEPSFQPDAEEIVSDDVQKTVYCVANFLTRFGEFSSEVSGTILQLFPIINHLLRKMACTEADMTNKCAHVALLLRTVSCASKFEIKFLQEQAPGLWPLVSEDNFVRDIVLGYEILSNKDFAVIKAFLKSLLDLLLSMDEEKNGFKENSVLPTHPWRDELIKDGVMFLFQIIGPMSWRSAPVITRNEILLGSLRVFHSLFNLPKSWDILKALVCSELVQPNSSLLSILKTDEEKLRECRIRPTEANSILENIMHLGLSLLLRLTNFEPHIYQFLDTASGSALIQSLAKLFSHRVITTLPCLAIKLLSKLAEDLNISILACIGHEMSAFCDLIILRLSYKSEDSDLRVATLQFLAVCVQTQPGMMNRFLEADTLPECIYSLLEEEESALPPATLTLVRVLVGKGNSILKQHAPNIWKLVTNPIHNLEHFESQDQRTIIACTMHILSFELYREGILDQELCTETSKILKSSVMKYIIRVAIQDPDPNCKCLLSIKHMMTLILSKPELSSLFEASVSIDLSKLVTHEFWRNKMNELQTRKELGPPLAEFMLLFANGRKHEYLQTLASNLVEDFFSETIAVQVPLLACLNKVVAHLKDEELSDITADNLCKIISRIFANAIKLYESEEGKKTQPLLSLAASTAFNIAQSKKPSTWLPVFHRQMLISAIVHVAHIGLEKAVGPEIVLECLSTLIKLCQRPETSTSVRNSGVSSNIWIPSLKFGTPETTGKWLDVYLSCCELNSVLVSTEKHFYLSEALNFWACHTAFLSYKLYDLARIVNQCFLNSPDKNYRQLVQTLTFNYFTLNSVSVMLPYITKWRLEQGKSLSEIMQGLFVSLQASVSLLTHPNHLLLVITKNSKGNNAPVSFRLTPQLLEVQNRLWDIILLGVHIYLKLRKKNINYVECNVMLPLLFSIIALPVKVLGKHGDKKSQPIINSTSKVTMTLEKTLSLVASRIGSHLQDSTVTLQQKQTFRRETMSEVGSICDSVRRLGLPSGDYSLKMCSAIELLYRNIPN